MPDVFAMRRAGRYRVQVRTAFRQVPLPHLDDIPMPAPNYSFEKRQRELAKKKKKEEKDAKKRAERDAARTDAGPEDAPADTPE